MADQITTVPTDLALNNRMMELIAATIGKRGVIPCGELELSVKNNWNGEGIPDTLFDRALFYSVLPTMKQRGKIGYAGVPADKTPIHLGSEPVWYVE